jgi:hypothetical protein
MLDGCCKEEAYPAFRRPATAKRSCCRSQEQANLKLRRVVPTIEATLEHDSGSNASSIRRTLTFRYNSVQYFFVILLPS